MLKNGLEYTIYFDNTMGFICNLKDLKPLKTQLSSYQPFAPIQNQKLFTMLILFTSSEFRKALGWWWWDSGGITE